MTIPEISAAFAIFVTQGGLIWHAATMAQKLKDLDGRFTKHEPTVVELAELKTMMTGMTSQLAEVKGDIQRLYDRRLNGGVK